MTEKQDKFKQQVEKTFGSSKRGDFVDFSYLLDAMIDPSDPRFIDYQTRLSELLVLTNPAIGGAVYKKAWYPITDFEIIVKGVEDDAEREKIIDAIREYIEKMRVREFLVEAGIDYSTYGIAILAIEVKGKKYLYCKKCRVMYSPDIGQRIFQSQVEEGKIDAFYLEIERDKKKGKADFKTNLKCPKCGKDMLLVDSSFAPHAKYFEEVRLEIADVMARAEIAGLDEEDLHDVRLQKGEEHPEGQQETKTEQKRKKGKKKTAQENEELLSKFKLLKRELSLARWNIREVELFTSRFSSHVHVVVKPDIIAEQIKELIKYGPLFLKDIDIRLLQAALLGEKVIIDPELVSVIRYPVPSGVNSPYYPALARAYREGVVMMKLYQTILDAADDFVPIHGIFSPADKSIGGFVSSSSVEKAKDFEEKVKRAKTGNKFQKYVFFDYPVQEVQIGGTSQFFSLFNAIDSLANNMMLGLDMPRSLLLEGTWTGNIVAMRLLENSLLHYVNSLNDFLEKVARAMRRVGIYSTVEYEIKLVPFRRIDMLQEYQFLLQVAPQYVPKEPLFLAYFGKDLESVLEQVQRERALFNRYDTFGQLEAELYAMQIRKFLEDNEKKMPIEEMAEKILKETGGDVDKIRRIIRALADSFNDPDYATDVLHVIKKRLKEMQLADEVETRKDQTKPSKKNA